MSIKLVKVPESKTVFLFQEEDAGAVTRFVNSLGHCHRHGWLLRPVSPEQFQLRLEGKFLPQGMLDMARLMVDNKDLWLDLSEEEE